MVSWHLNFVTLLWHYVTGRGGGRGRGGARGGGGGVRAAKTGAIQDYKGSKVTFDDDSD